MTDTPPKEENHVPEVVFKTRVRDESIGGGLSDVEVSALQQRYGYNELPTRKENPVLQYFKNFWGPLPWLMEILVVISIASGDSIEAAVIAVLLVINAAISTMQRRSTEAALATLSKHLTIFARVKRADDWRSIPTRELVPGDLIRVRGGDVVPADAAIIEGDVNVDLSTLTGESLPRDESVSGEIYSGSIVRRGEATARVASIGTKTMYGKTTELLETSHPPTHMERVIFGVVKFFFFWNLALAIVIAVFGWAVHAPASDVANFVIVLLLTSVPIAFPTMFAIAQSYGALELSRERDRRTLVRRLAAVQECATVDVLCSDKTGTLTMNELRVVESSYYGTTTETQLLALAAACSDEADHDPIDNAIITAARERGAESFPHERFIPFNSQTKRTEADVTVGGRSLHILKGLPEILLTLDIMYHEEAKGDVARLSETGLRVVAVIAEENGVRACVGLIGLADPIRPDARQMIEELRALGIRTVMITGDGRTTAHTVAASLGLLGTVATPQDLHADPSIATRASVFAETYPEDKLVIIRALQSAGHVVAMTGDGVNDAPALHQAEVGIAVSGATDVAKQSASFILTNEGLEGVIAAVKVSRGVYARLRTWTLNKIIKSVEVSIFTTTLFFITHSYIFSPILAVLLIFANDFITIAIATDTAQPTPAPGKWRVGNIAAGSVILAIPPLLALTAVYLVAHHLGYSLSAMRIIIYLTLVWCGIGTLYAVRSWPHAWQLKPSMTLAAASSFSFLFALAVACSGIFVPPLSAVMIGCILIAAISCFFLTDLVKSARLVRYLVISTQTIPLGRGDTA